VKLPRLKRFIFTNYTLALNDELGGTRQGAVTIHFKVSSQHSTAATEITTNRGISCLRTENRACDAPNKKTSTNVETTTFDDVCRVRLGTMAGIIRPVATTE
jgi:hypothetical protein